jgi:protein-disulfide isomerase
MNNKKSLFIGSAIFLIALFVIAIFVYNNAKREAIESMAAENMKVFVRDYSPTYGDENAKVYLTEFLDPECESCRALYPEVKNILKEYKGKVQLVVRYAPFHKNSKVAIKALEAARIQGKYWEALEKLFHYQSFWGNHHNPKPELIFEYLLQMGLDMEKLRADMESSKITDMIEQDMKDLRQLNVRGTPTFFVNGKPLEQFGIPSLKKLIESEVKSIY